MIELDPGRLPRIGIDSVDEIDVERILSIADMGITIPTEANPSWPWYWRPVVLVQGTLAQVWSVISRRLLTGMYDTMKAQMKSQDVVGGGEFLRAIQAAENCTTCDTLILGDRSSVETLRRAASLALQSGDALGVWNRLQDANAAQTVKLEQSVREQLQSQQDHPVEESDVSVAMMEALKTDGSFREEIFSTLEQQVPEFTQAFLKERDYLMGESVRVQLERPDVKKVVAVVGLGHVPGIVQHLEAAFCNATLPLFAQSTQPIR